MPAPKKPNPAPAAAKRRRQGDETQARRLRKHGWLLFPPEVVALLPEATMARLRQLSQPPPPTTPPVE